jgi:hypothetical protein
MLLVLALLAQATGGDAGVLIVRQDTLEVAREAFRLTPSPGRADTAWTLATTIRWDRSRPIVTLAPVIELAQSGRPRALEYDVTDGRGTRRILAQFSATRATLREVAPGIERARELAATGPTLVLDDSVFALYAAAVRLAGPEPRRAIAIVPRAGRRDSVTITDHGEAMTTLAGRPARLRQVQVAGGALGDVWVWTTPDGRLARIDVPARRLSAERAPDR